MKTFDNLSLIGGRPCLDFVNTEGSVRNGSPEWLESYADLIGWSEHAGEIDADRATSLATRAAADPGAANEVYERAVALRESLYRILHAVADADPPAAEDLAVFDRELGRALGHLRLAPDGERFAWLFRDSEALDAPLWPIVYDAAELLSSEVVERVKECEGDACSWVFLDVSRNRSRRWCKMGDCGNRAKARRYYRRHRSSSS